MQLRSSSPMNFRIMKLDASRLSRVPRITSPETYDGIQTKLHPEGLFSPIFFGAVGTQQRDYTFGVIKLNTTIMHPQVCKWLKQLKRLNEDIWMGRKFAKFDTKTGEFIETDELSGDTGYSFFVEHIPQMKFKKNNSVRRTQVIRAMEKYKDAYFLDHFLVLPAGLRDVQMDETGRATEDEINEYYRKMIRISNAIENTSRKQGPELNQVRLNLQLAANEIDLYIDTLLSGKKGFLQGKWASRKLHLSSRNVVTAQDPSVTDLDDPNRITVDTVQIGLFQVMASLKPVVASYMKAWPLMATIFPVGVSYANLVHPTRLVRTQVECEDWQLSQWTTNEGVELLIKKFEKESFRTMPAMINGHYIALIYRDEEKYQVLSDIEDLPEGWNKSNVHPITYLELFYLIGKDNWNDTMLQCTRYPVTGDESIFTGDALVLPCIETSKLQEYVGGQPTDSYAYQYPSIVNPTYVASVSVSATKIKQMGGDYDGDKISSTPIVSEEAISENRKINDDYYSLFKPSGDPVYDVGTEIVQRVCYAMTREIHPERKHRSNRGA